MIIYRFWNQNGSKGGGEKWSDLGYILKAELIAFADRFDSLKEKVKNDSRVFTQATPLSTEERKTVRGANCKEKIRDSGLTLSLHCLVDIM